MTSRLGQALVRVCSSCYVQSRAVIFLILLVPLALDCTIIIIIHTLIKNKLGSAQAAAMRNTGITHTFSYIILAKGVMPEVLQKIVV